MHKKLKTGRNREDPGLCWEDREDPGLCWEDEENPGLCWEDGEDHGLCEEDREDSGLCWEGPGCSRRTPSCAGRIGRSSATSASRPEVPSDGRSYLCRPLSMKHTSAYLLSPSSGSTSVSTAASMTPATGSGC